MRRGKKLTKALFRRVLNGIRKEQNNIIYEIEMPNQIVICMAESYPFGESNRGKRAREEVLVKQSVKGPNRQMLLSKARHLKKLKFPYAVEIVHILEERDLFEVYYEYVPVKFENWMKTLSKDLYKNLLKQLYSFATFLSLNRIRTQILLQNLGFNEDYNIKYFIDLNRTSIDDQFSPNALKQKYYQEISSLVRSLDSGSDRTLYNPMYHSLKAGQSLNLNDQTIVDVLGRTSSLSNFHSYNKSLQISDQINLSQAQKQIKKSALKKSQVICAQRLENIEEMLVEIRESRKFRKKTHEPLTKVEKSGSNHSTIASQNFQYKNSINQAKTFRTPSIDKLIDRFQRAKQSIKQTKSRPGSDEIKQEKKELVHCGSGEQKFSKSDRQKTPKNSQSPVEYLDMCKSPEKYVQDFLNVLEDTSEQEEEELEIGNGYNKNERSINTTKLTIEADPQPQNPKNKQEWKERYNKVINNSRRLIERFRMPSSPVLRVMNR